jgi:hypothetical protein
MEWNHRGGDASTSNEPDVRIKWIISKRPIASKQLGIMAVICSSITAKGLGGGSVHERLVQVAGQHLIQVTYGHLLLQCTG